MIYFDTETCGLHGPVTLLQWAEDEGPVHLVDVWKKPVGEILELIEFICERDVCGFNLTFDWFHIQQLYTIFTLLAKNHGHDAIPEDYINECGVFEQEARSLDLCCKPRSAMDLMLHSRKGPYQSLMARKPIKIRRVPRAMAYTLQSELSKRLDIDDIYFSRRKDKHAPKWKILESKRPGFFDVVLDFAPSASLKTLAHHALGKAEDDIIKFLEVEPDVSLRPFERGWAPFAMAVSSPDKEWKVRVKKKGVKKVTIKYAWPGVIQKHINHWAYHTAARKYATDDVINTRDLHHHFGDPPAGDDDSELACMVGATRWKGFKIDIPAIKEQIIEARNRIGDVPTSPAAVKGWISEVLDPIEVKGFTSTAKIALEAMTKMQCDCAQEEDDFEIAGLSFAGLLDDDDKLDKADCPKCGGTGVHPAAARAKTVLDSRKAIKEIEVFEKLIQAGRLHASFKVIGTLSSRMSGADGLNPQAINRKKEVRGCFQLWDEGFALCGGDFDSFEVVLAEAVYNDPKLRKALTELQPCLKCDATGKYDNQKDCKKCKGAGCEKCADDTCDECGGTKEATFKIHALFALKLFPGKTYQDVIRSKGTSFDMYSMGKTAVFALLYGGDWSTIVRKQGIPEDVAKKAYFEFINEYKGVKEAQEKIDRMFCSMQQPDGTGSKIVWNDPADSIESLMGFSRFFTLENQIVRALYELGSSIPKSWKKFADKVSRSDGREQTAFGATTSAIYGAGFGIQGTNKRAATNHVIQSSGATITKHVQRRAWDFQPCGVKRWRIYGMNIHDEVLLCCRPEIQDEVEAVVNATVESFRPRVPLIKFEFQKNMKSWAEK